MTKWGRKSKAGGGELVKGHGTIYTPELECPATCFATVCISVRSQHISYACFEWLTPFKLGCALAVLAKIIEMIDFGYMEEKPSPL